MSDTKSNASYSASAVEFNSKSLNPLAGLPPSTISKIKREADAFASCSEKCARLWAALAKHDIAGSNLTETVLEAVFGEFQSELYQFTRIDSLHEFMRLFDADRDGCLNPDEQISIFSFIKQRLELAANNCLHIQQYLRFEGLMKEVRQLERLIQGWQQHLRSKCHASQLGQYRQRGHDRVLDFCSRCEADYAELEAEMLRRRELFETRAELERQQLEEALGTSEHYLKIKPNNRLKELQFQEKLVSLEERVYEALDFRKELNELEVKEKERVDQLMERHAQHQRHALLQRQQRGRRELELKLRELEDKFIVRMKREYDVLLKKNGLHENEIKRLQALEAKWAHRKATEEPELARTKLLKRQRNEVLQQLRLAVKSSAHPAEQETTKSKINAKSMLEATLKFKIVSKDANSVPVNRRAQSSAKTLEKYLEPVRPERQHSLAKMYSDALEPLPVAPLKTKAEQLSESTRQFNFVLSKVSHLQ